MSTYYNIDLAKVHDQDFDQLATDAASLIKSQVSGQIIVDLGCGSGTLARILSNSGFQVIGVDYSADMIELARQNAPEASFVQASIFEYEIPNCDQITLLGEVICYLFDYKNDDLHLISLFEKCYQCLNKPGILLFDFLTPDVVTEGHIARRFIERDNWSMFITLDKDVSNTILTRDITLFYKDGALYRRSQEIHRQRLFQPHNIRQILEEIGFTIELIDSYGGEKFRTGHVGIVAMKL